MNNCAVCPKSHFFTQNVITDIDLMLPITYTNLRFWGHFGRFWHSVTKIMFDVECRVLTNDVYQNDQHEKAWITVQFVRKVIFSPEMSSPTSTSCYPSPILTFDFGVILADFHFHSQKSMIKVEYQVLTNDVHSNDQHQKAWITVQFVEKVIFSPKMSSPTSTSWYSSSIPTFDFGVIFALFHFRSPKSMFKLECQLLTNDVHSNDQHQKAWITVQFVAKVIFSPKMSSPTSTSCYSSPILTFDFGVILADFHLGSWKIMFEVECRVLINDVYRNDQH